MPTYQVRVHGKRVRLVVDGLERDAAFHATRVVAAATPCEAERIAFETLRRELSSKIASVADAVEMIAESTARVSPVRALFPPQGFTWSIWGGS